MGGLPRVPGSAPGPSVTAMAVEQWHPGVALLGRRALGLDGLWDSCDRRPFSRARAREWPPRAGAAADPVGADRGCLLYTAVSLRPRNRNRPPRGCRCRGPARRRGPARGRLRLYRLLHRRDPPCPRPSRPPAVPQTRTTAGRGARRVHAGRLRRQYRRQHGELPRRTHRRPGPTPRPPQPARGQLQRSVHRMPPARTVHESQGRARSSPSGPRVRRRPGRTRPHGLPPHSVGIIAHTCHRSRIRGGAGTGSASGCA